MPVVIPKPLPKPVELVPRAAPPPPALTLADVQAMLDARDAAWARQLDSMAQTFNAALAANKPAPKTGASITIKRDLKGVLVGAEITPKA